MKKKVYGVCTKGIIKTWFRSLVCTIIRSYSHFSFMKNDTRKTDIDERGTRRKSLLTAGGYQNMEETLQHLSIS